MDLTSTSVTNAYESHVFHCVEHLTANKRVAGTIPVNDAEFFLNILL